MHPGVKLRMHNKTIIYAEMNLGTQQNISLLLTIELCATLF